MSLYLTLKNRIISSSILSTNYSKRYILSAIKNKFSNPLNSTESSDQHNEDISTKDQYSKSFSRSDISMTNDNLKNGRHDKISSSETMPRSEIILGRNKLQYLEFKKSLQNPTVITNNHLLEYPDEKDIPPNIPNKIFSVATRKKITGALIFPPKPLQESHEYFLFDSVLGKIEKGENEKLLSPEDRFNLMVDKTFRRVSQAFSGDDLVVILRNNWLSPDSILANKEEALRRTLEIFLQLGQIKQFAFLNSSKLDCFIGEILDHIETNLFILSNDQLVDTFWVFAKLGVRPAEIVDRLVAKVERLLTSFSMGQLADIFYAFTETRIVSPKLYHAVENSILNNNPRSLKELTSVQLFQLSYSVMLGCKPQDQRKQVCWTLCKRIGEVWRTRPFVPLSSMLQMCRFTTAISLMFPEDRFKGLIPNDLREKSLFLFKSGRTEMYSPPFLDPMARETIKAHTTTMISRFQDPESAGMNGWWVWQLERRSPPFSLEPASRTWYTRFDDKRRLLGSYLFRTKLIGMYGLSAVHIPYYEWEHLTTFRSQYKYIEHQMELQLGISSRENSARLISHMFNVTIRGRNITKDHQLIEKDRDIAWDWDELCRINAKNGINPNVYLNSGNFKVPAPYYNDEERLKKPDYWND